MLRLNDDVVSLILEELQVDKKSIYSCILVNRTWCKNIVKILWKNPWKKFGKKQFNIILSHLPSKTKDKLRSQGINLPQQKPLFNYIGFCKYLNMPELQKTIYAMNIDESIGNEIFDLFINKKRKFTHLSILSKFNYQINLITEKSEEFCFSELKSLQLSNDTNQVFLEGLVSMNISIKELTFVASSSSNNSEIIKLIEVQKNLNHVHFSYQARTKNQLFCELLEESLIKHANTIQYLIMGWKPITNVLSYFANLISLELELNVSYNKNWDHLENLSFPMLKFLKAQFVSSKILTSLIKNTKGYLSEISIHRYDADNKKLIQAIHQNSPKLKYLKIRLVENIIPEFETLLINCQNLNGLVVTTGREKFDWNILFKTLTKSSPISLFKFKFYSYFDEKPSLKSLELFFNDWKGRYPMLLQTFQIDVPSNTDEYSCLFEKYKTKRIIKKYDGDDCFESFEWIQKRID